MYFVRFFWNNAIWMNYITVASINLLYFNNDAHSVLNPACIYIMMSHVIGLQSDPLLRAFLKNVWFRRTKRSSVIMIGGDVAPTFLFNSTFTDRERFVGLSWTREPHRHQTQDSQRQGENTTKFIFHSPSQTVSIYLFEQKYHTEAWASYLRCQICLNEGERVFLIFTILILCVSMLTFAN